MPLPRFEELFAHADAARPGFRVVAVGGADATVLRALRQASDRGWVRAAVTGDRQAIEAIADKEGLALEGIEVVDTPDPARTAVARIRAGGGDLLMKGQVSTPDLLKAMLASDGLRTDRVVCQVVLMELPRDDRRFLLADTGITPRPDLRQKRDILASAVDLAHALGMLCPRVAVMSATEKPTDALPDSQEAAQLQHRPSIADCVVQGPMSFDLAYATEAGDRKQVGGPVAGSADVMLFPDLTSANLTVKAIMYTADCKFGGVLCGAACPVVFMSRADSVSTRLRSLALALRTIAVIAPRASG